MRQSKKFVAILLAVMMLLSVLSTTAFAENAQTIAGEPETVTVSADIYARNNSFNDGWKFYLGTSGNAQNVNFDDSGWKSVKLPHDFSISQAFTTSGEAESGFLPGGTGWYRKSFTLPENMAGKEIVLSFDGVYSNAYVYVNGTQVGENHYGYNAFAFDITNYVTCDGITENVIAVKAVNNIPSSRWYSGSGIYRDVTLIVTDPVHVELNGTKVTTPNIANGNGTVNVEVEVKNDGNTTAGVTVRNTVVDSNGNTVVTAPDKTISVSAGAAATTTTSGTVSNPTLWDIDNPVQYKVVTEVLVNDTVADTYTTNFGFRYYSFDKNNGFYLNGRAVKLNGVCMHHDQGALGSAAYYDAMYRQLFIMKDMGANAIRTSHNIADEHFIDICNKLGLLVIEEAFDGWTYAKNGNSNDFSQYFNTKLESSNHILGGDSNKTWAQYAIQSMVKRDRNDPSIIMWSLCNEVQEGGSSDSTYATIAQNLINWIKELDTTRPATIGDNTRSTSASGNIGGVLNVIQNNGGVLGFNYGSDPYSSLNSAWTAPIYASETSSAVNSRGVYSTQASNSLNSSYHLTSYDTSAVGWGATAHDSMYRVLTKDYVAGEFVWTGFDYIGEPTPKNGTGTGSVTGAGAIPNSSYFGIVETTGFEKDTYYLYRSQWNQQETTAHLVTAWDSDNMLTTSGKTPVVIYSNAPVVKLYLNGAQIGTATRKVNTTSAGHSYYTYTTASNNSVVCSAVSASGSASLYATFNVAYTAGTISVKAFDASGKDITNTVGGKTSVSTPGTVSKLNISVNKSEIDADGSSLAYITVDVVDANGNLDTTASNTINFSLTGNGEIVGVDNGDQATTAKYQQSSVLTNTTSAHINAYAGKALVIVRSTKDAGSFTVNCTSSGLTGGSATVTTTAVTDGSDVQTGLASYTMVRDYTVKAGTVPALQTAATGTLANGTEVTGTIAWNSIPAATYNTPGDYTVNGVLTIAGETIPVTAKLHVIANVIAMRNVATAVMAGQVPTLPSTVRGVLADGTLSGEFTVVWDAMTESQFQTVGDIVVVNGTATVMGNETLPVTASVRVAETVNTSSTNVATAAHVSQDIPTAYQSDNLSSVNNGVTTPGDNTSERWSNWKNRTNSAKATLTLTWDTAQMLSSVNIYYYLDNCATVPESVIFSYSMNGVDYSTISYVAAEDETVHNVYHRMFTYTFAQPVNPVALQIEFTQQSGTTGTHCVAVSEIETMTFAGSIEYQSSAALSSLLVDGVSVPNFDAATYAYTAAGSTVTAESAENTGITILPALDNVVRVLVLSEDGQIMNTYAVTLTESTGCQHTNTEIRNASEATCTEAGYTGDTYCTACGEKLSSGSVIPATGHTTETRNAKAATCTEAGYTGDKVCTVCGVTVETGTTIPAKGHTAETRNAKAATCTEAGYTGDTYCTVCGEKLSTGSTIPAKGHTWNSGVVTKQPTTTEEGVKTFTCTTCGATKTEAIPKLQPGVEKLVPEATVTVAKAANNKVKMIGTFVDYANKDQYYEVTAHGLVYMTSAKLGQKSLTISTTGRTKVTFSQYSSEGNFSYTFSPAKPSTKYIVRAFLTYTDANGKSVTVYSDPLLFSYDSAK